MPTEDITQKLRAILNADVKDYSRLMSQDQVDTIQTLTVHREAISGFVQRYGGRVVDTPGDSLLAAFDSVSNAVNCAVEIQRDVSQRNAEVPSAFMMQWRIGINIGDVVEEEGRIYGDSVNIAARIESLAEPGGICISGMVYDQVKNRLGLRYVDLGEQVLKNIADPVRTYRLLMAHGTTIDTGSSAPSLPEKSSIAVLPFGNMSDDADQEYFCDAITEEIITRLSMNARLTVMARNATFHYKDKPVNIQQVGQELGVRHVLEGSIGKADGQVKITAQLVDTMTGGYLWSETHDREFKDILKVLGKIARQIASALNADYTTAELSRIRRLSSENLTATDALWRALALFHQHEKHANTRARECCESATGLDSNFAKAYELLGFTHLQDYLEGWSPNPQDALDQAYASAQRVLSLNTYSSGAHDLLAYIYAIRNQKDRAIAGIERAISIAPNDAGIYSDMANILLILGRPEEAIRSVRKAMALDPHSPATHAIILGKAYRMIGSYEEAIETLEGALSRNPDWIVAYLELATNYRMAWSAKQNRGSSALDWALEMAEKHVSTDDTSSGGHSELSLICLYKKLYERALSEAEKVAALAPENADSYALLAVIFNSIGRSDEAIEMMGKAMQRNPAIPAWYLPTLGDAYGLSGRHAEAEATHRSVFDHNPSHFDAFNARLSLAIVCAELDRGEKAQAEAKEILKLSPNFSVEVWGERHPNRDQARIEQNMAALRNAGLR
ncbi:MAG: tetratricopeptide repeat protein [Desulfobacterales bacterium]